MDGWDSLFNLAPGVPGFAALAAVVAIAVRMVVKADSRYHDEVKDHERTQQTLDDERDKRRKAEDEASKLTAKLRRLGGDETG